MAFSRFRIVMAVALAAFAVAPLFGVLDAPAEALAAIRARINLPPETDDPMRPANLRLLKLGEVV